MMYCTLYQGLILQEVIYVAYKAALILITPLRWPITEGQSVVTDTGAGLI